MWQQLDRFRFSKWSHLEGSNLILSMKTKLKLIIGIVQLQGWSTKKYDSRLEPKLSVD